MAEEADGLYRQKDLDGAHQAFTRALEAAVAQGSEPDEARARMGLAQIALDRARYDEAQALATRAAEIYERLGDSRGIGRAHHSRGLALDERGELEAAGEAFSLARRAFDAAGDPRGRGMATLALIFVKRRPLAEDAQLYASALADAREAGDRALQGRVAHSWGDRLFTEDEYAAALERLLEAERLFREAGEEVSLGTVYNSLGRLYRTHGQPEIALDYQLKALALHERGQQPFFHMQSLNAVAVTYESLDDARSARQHYTKALAVAEKIASQRVQDFLRANIASSTEDPKELPAAAAVLEGVLSRGLDSFVSRRWTQLSQIYERLGRHDAALAAAGRGVETCGRPEGRDCVMALAERARAHAALGDAAAARQDLAAALEAIDAARARLVPVDFFKQRFHQARETVYSRAIAVHFDAQGEASLEMAEMARARGFLDLLATRQSEPSAVPGEAARGQSGPETAARSGGRAGELPWLQNTATTSAATLPEITAAARRLDSTFLFYWVSWDRVFIWVVGPDGIVAARSVTVSSSRIAELVRATNPATPAPPAARTGGRPISSVTRSRSAWRELHRLLIAPVERQLPREAGALLTIVPHGPLTSLTFAALTDTHGRYLLERFTLHYIPAAGVLSFTGSMSRTLPGPGQLLLVADPVPPRGSPLDLPLPRLPGARAEVRSVSRLLDRSRVESLVGGSATEARIRPAVSGKDVLHFATHAIVRDDEPFSSFLALGASGEAPGEDGFLTAAEIYGLRLDARLVVLTACRSAGGGVPGDGIAAFSRAFIYAGTPSIVASLWDVADRPTDTLVPAFYRRWIGGMSVASALRGAQLELLRNLRAGKVRITTPAGEVAVAEAPRLWASFMLVGEPR